MTKYALDTNLYVRAFRSAASAVETERFLTGNAPAIRLSSIVLHELLVGAASAAMERDIEEGIARVFRKTGRIFAPSPAAWEHAGLILAQIVRREKLDRRTMDKSFTNDVLLAASCREAGIVLITENRKDFARIAGVTRFEFVAPWPA